MAVEARRLSHLPTQLLVNKQMMMMNAIDDHSNRNAYNAPLGFGISGTTTADTLLPIYGSVFTDSINHDTNALKADSGLTYSLPPVSRKRPRDFSSNYPLLSYANGQNMKIDRSGTFTFLGEDISLQIQQQQLEIDQIIDHHTEKLRMDIEERRQRNSRRIIAAVEEGISKKIRAKEEEIVKIAKLNWALEEKVKSLYVENQIWRELAQTNEATANALRSNLKQVLEQVVHDDYRHRSTAACEDDAAALADDAQSCCESNNEERHTLVEQDSGKDDCTSSSRNRLCKNCEKEESCVLLLPCRHLCLCAGCASAVTICPICKSNKTISVHVHMS